MDLEVHVGKNGYHSGEVGGTKTKLHYYYMKHFFLKNIGIVPETFRIVRSLLDRFDDPKTGKVDSAFDSDIPEWKIKEVK